MGKYSRENSVSRMIIAVQFMIDKMSVKLPKETSILEILMLLLDNRLGNFKCFLKFYIIFKNILT